MLRSFQKYLNSMTLTSLMYDKKKREAITDKKEIKDRFNNYNKQIEGIIEKLEILHREFIMKFNDPINSHHVGNKVSMALNFRVSL